MRGFRSYVGDMGLVELVRELNITPEDIERARNPDPEILRSIGEKYGGPGWTYHNVNHVAAFDWQRFLATIGADDYRILAHSENGDRCRGQIVVSPDGRRRALRSASPAVKRMAAACGMRNLH